MKKFLIAILIVLAISIIGFVAYASLQIVGFYITLSKDTSEMTKEELAICLKQNEVKFNNISDMLFKHPSITDITWRDEYVKEDKNKFYYSTNNKVYIKSKDKLDSSAITEIENSSIKFIFENQKFKSIMPMEDCIYFIKASNLGYASGIVFSPKKEKPEYEYLIKLERIEDKWFYFRFR